MKWSSEADRAFLATLPPDAPAVRDMPEVWPEVAWYLEAFNELTWSRPVGMGIGYIPISEVVAWADANGVEDVALLIRHIRALDAVYVAECIERQKRDADRRANERGHVQGADRP